MSDTNAAALGIKDIVDDVIVENTAKELPTEAVAPAASKQNFVPRIFGNKDARIDLTVVGYFDSGGELKFVLPKVEDSAADESAVGTGLLNTYEFTFVFTRVAYDKLNRYRSRSMIYNSEDKNNTINQLRLREFFLVFHLVDWDVCDDDGNKIELKFDPTGVLSDESLEVVYQLPPSILDMVLALYESKINIV